MVLSSGDGGQNGEDRDDSEDVDSGNGIKIGINVYSVAFGSSNGGEYNQ